ncbi:otopetrin [Schistosoma japonicum]|uniref:Otopetrin n=2 Tax=Schistosoma japonicum TaxID=6182 RepID=A0A4Z2DEE1_SCHJA|nr:otopetrin [Schistosoma japonicum]
MANSGYSTDNSDTDQNNSYPLKEKSKLKRHTKRKNHRKRFGRMAKSWKFIKMRKLWERDLAKQRSISAPFVPIKANNKYESMTASLLFMFAVTQCIFGFVLPICDSFGVRGSKQNFEADHKYYLEIFLISQYCGAVLVLAYLQYLIYSGMKQQLRQTLINEICRSKNSCELVDDKHMIINEHQELSEPNIIISTDYGNNLPPVSPYDKLSDIESTTSERQFSRLIHYYNDNNNQEKRYVSIHPEGLNLYMRLGAVGFGLGVMIHDGFNLSSVWEVSEPVCHSKLWIPKHIIRIIWVLWQTYFVFKYHRVILHRHRVTVRLACIHLATINFCHWLKVVVGEVAHTLKAPVLYSSTFHSPHISNIHLDNYNKTHTSLGGYNRNHTQSSYNAVSNDTMTGITDGGSIPKVCLGYLGVTLDPFLFPLAIEYSLITGSFFYKMLQRLDQTYPKSFNNASNGSECLELNSPSLLSPSPPSTANSISKNEFDRLNSSLFLDDDILEQQYRHQECTKHMTYRPVMGCKVFLPLLKQNKLPILNEYYTESIGIMLLIASIVCLVLFLLRERNNSRKFTAFIYQKSKLALSSIGLFACIMAILQTNQLKFRRLKRGESFEYNLLTIGLIGCITYHMFLFIPALEIVIHLIIFHQINLNNQLNIEQFNNDLNEYTIYLSNKTMNDNLLNDQHIQYTALLYLVKCTLEICQALLQFFFIVETSRRKVCCINQARIKPGRSVIVFLLICNLALWLVNTFEVRSAETQLPLYRQYFGVRTWSVITYCFIPLIIFFRFHSTVCLAELWTKLYTLR